MSGDIVDATGAPTDQGQVQGRAERERIATATARVRGRHGWFTWRDAKRFVRRGSARATAQQLPGLHERLEGISRASGVSLGALQVAQAWDRVQGNAFCEGTTLAACFDLLELRDSLILRASRPDAGGFPSIELTCAHWVGCLAGVNAEGLGALCVRDPNPSQAPMRLLAQEFLFRSRDLGAGIDHIRRRGSYLGGSGVVVVGDATGTVRELSFHDGELNETEAQPSALPAQPSVTLDLAARRLSCELGSPVAPEAVENPEGS